MTLSSGEAMVFERSKMIFQIILQMDTSGASDNVSRYWLKLCYPTNERLSIGKFAKEFQGAFHATDPPPSNELEKSAQQRVRVPTANTCFLFTVKFYSISINYININD